MKIDQQGLPPSSSKVEGAGSQVDTGSRPKPSSGGTSVQDQAQFSSLGATASQLRSTLNSVPEVRQDRVDYYRQQIASGSYTVDPQAVAGAILNDQGGNQDGH